MRLLMSSHWPVQRQLHWVLTAVDLLHLAFICASVFFEGLDPALL